MMRQAERAHSLSEVAEHLLRVGLVVGVAHEADSDFGSSRRRNSRAIVIGIS